MVVADPLFAVLLADFLEKSWSRWLALAGNGPELLAPLAGKVIAIRLWPHGGALYFCPTATGMQVLGEFSGAPDVILAGTPSALFRQRLGGAARGTLQPGEIEISGDSDTARRFQNLLDLLAIDWERHLARYTGRGIAASVVELIRRSGAAGRAGAAALGTDLAEFWQEETRELPARPEAEAFLDAVDTLRADADRLEARIQRLEAARHPSP